MEGETIHGSGTVQLSQNVVNSILQLWKVLQLRLSYENSCMVHFLSMFFVCHPFARVPHARGHCYTTLNFYFPGKQPALSEHNCQEVLWPRSVLA